MRCSGHCNFCTSQKAVQDLNTLLPFIDNKQPESSKIVHRSDIAKEALDKIGITVSFLITGVTIIFY